MKNRITERGIAILMAIVLLALVPVSALNEKTQATLTDLTEQESDQGASESGNDYVPVVLTVSKAIEGTEITVILTTAEKQDEGAKLPTVSKFDEPEIEQKAEDAFRPENAETQHLLLKFSGCTGIKGKISVELQNAGLKNWKSANEAKNTIGMQAVEYIKEKKAVRDFKAAPDWTNDKVTCTIDGNIILDFMLTAVPKEDTSSGSNQQEEVPAADSGSDKAQEGKSTAQKEESTAVQPENEGTPSGTSAAQPADTKAVEDKEPESAQDSSPESDAAPVGAVVIQTRDTKVLGGTDSSEPARDPNLIYAPDGTIYDPDRYNARPGGVAIGDSFNILDPVKTSGDTGTLSSSAPSGEGLTATPATDTEEEEEAEKEEVVTAGTETVGSGYNVVLVGLKENNTESETWSLLNRNGIVFEDFRSGESVPADTEELMQAGLDGVRKEDDPEYWDSPAAAKTATDLIYQFGFYAILESEQKENDAEVLRAVAERLVNEGVIINSRNMPFYMEIQLTGNSGGRDSLADLILEMDADGLSANTVLLFAPTGLEEGKTRLIMVHPAIQEGMAVRTAVKAADVLPTVLVLSGNADASWQDMLKTLPGRNLLAVEEFSGLEGLIPELAEAAGETAGGTAGPGENSGDSDTGSDSEGPAHP